MLPVLLLDGPVGTELTRRGVSTPAPQWSAQAIDSAPTVLAAIHADYAEAGATVHTANTFRTDPWSLRTVPAMAHRWRELTRSAVSIARASVPAGHLVAGSLAPLEDCYRPDLAPPAATCSSEHRRFSAALVESGVDLILCETFAHPGEALIAVTEALTTGLPVWLSLTLGPSADLMDEQTLLSTARSAVDLGVEAVLVNCSPVEAIGQLVTPLHALGVKTGGYGNVGAPDEAHGWIAAGEDAPGAYAAAACAWVAAGAEIVGGCCGTSPEHIRALSAALHS
jgi:S-methylmethionine-dependent homocysteine/selenocysteine methylase